jgi:asparagine synthase (glutamine-hydrolysing)
MFYFTLFKNHDEKSDFHVKNESVLSKCVADKLYIDVFAHQNLLLDVKNHLFTFQTESTFVFFCGNLFNTHDFEVNLHANKNLAEFIYNLYVKNEMNFVQKLVGEYCFVIYESVSGTLFVVKDHLGIIPLSYTQKEDNFYFSSNAYELSLMTLKNRDDFEPDFLLFNSKYANSSVQLSKHVHRIKPGHYLQIKNNSISEIKYWFPEKIKQNKKITYEVAFEKYKDLIETCVIDRISADLNPAVHVSGGIDSAYLSAILKKHIPEKLQFGLSRSPKFLQSENIEFDERNHVFEICKTLKLTPIFFDENDFLKNESTENPFPNLRWNMEDYLLNFCNQNGINHLFSGYGGDDFVSINQRGVESDLFFKFKWNYLNRYSSLKKKIKHVLFNAIYPKVGYVSSKYRKYDKKHNRYVNLPYKKNDKDIMNRSYYYNSRKDVHLNSIYSYQITKDLEDIFVIGNLKGVKYSFPFLDKRLIEFMMELPSELFIDYSFSLPNRIFLRNACKEYFSDFIYLRNRKTEPLVNEFYKQDIEKTAKKIMDNFDDFRTFGVEKFLNTEWMLRDWKKYESGEMTDSEDIDILFNALLTATYIKEFETLCKNTSEIKN